MIPRTLEEWTIESIRNLLTKKVFESDSFDFKVALPNSKNNDAKNHLKKTCCAFANSEGGFLIYGISDDKELDSEGRLEGVDSNLDFPACFGNYPKMCSPSIEWDFKNPPLVLVSGKLIHVVHIPKSWRSPHSVGGHEEGWHFTKRTSKGNEGMNTEEIRSAFLGFYEKRLKLSLLSSELKEIVANAESCFIDDEEKITQSYSLITFELGIIESVISDTYSITASLPDLLSALSRIRQQVRLANTRIRMLHNQVVLPMSDLKSTIREHNTQMKDSAGEIIKLCNEACGYLESIVNE
jgi:hypothetical protein